MFEDGGDANGFGWQRRSGFYVVACLWLLRGLRPQRIGDPSSEVLVPSSPGIAGKMFTRLRGLCPVAHCILSVVCRRPQELRQVHFPTRSLRGY